MLDRFGVGHALVLRDDKLMDLLRRHPLHHLGKWYWLPMWILVRICKIGVETTGRARPFFYPIKKEVLISAVFRARKLAKKPDKNGGR